MADFDEVAYQKLPDFVCSLDDPLLHIYERFKVYKTFSTFSQIELSYTFPLQPFSDTMKTAFLTASLIYGKQCSSGNQWRKIQFLDLLQSCKECSANDALPGTDGDKDESRKEDLLTDPNNPNMMDTTNCMGYEDLELFS